MHGYCARCYGPWAVVVKACAVDPVARMLTPPPPAHFPLPTAHHQALKQDEAWSEFKERCTAEGCSVTHLDISACPGVSDKAFGPLAGFAYLKVRRLLWPSVVRWAFNSTVYSAE